MEFFVLFFLRDYERRQECVRVFYHDERDFYAFSLSVNNFPISFRFSSVGDLFRLDTVGATGGLFFDFSQQSGKT